jgi:adenylate cyclase
MFLQDRIRLLIRGVTRRRRSPHPTFVFADLVGYTEATERIGDEAAARLAREFRRTMCAISCRAGARQVKSMGDGVMIWAHDPASAIQIAERAVREGARADLLPVRVGVHTGAAVRDGRDWYGTAVNVAARLAAQAGPNEALVSASTRAAAGGRAVPPLSDRRELLLRGIARPVTAWRLA